MKNKLLLLVSILLSFVSSCSSIPTEEPTVEISSSETEIPTTEEPTDVPTETTTTEEPTEEIYYLDGLASNLFVTEVPENVECKYLEDSDSYIAYAQTKKDGIVYENIDCIIPNVYDDGIHGLKRVKTFWSYFYEGGYYNKLIISEGIEIIRSGIGDNLSKEIYFPSTTKKMCTLFQRYPEDWTDEQRDVYNNSKSYYNGTISQFNQIEEIEPDVCVDSVPGKYAFICLDGVAYFNNYHGVEGCLQS